MMRKSWIVAVLFLLLASGAAARAGDNPFRVVVAPESVFARALPDFNAEAVASLFKNDPLLVISRNLDGTWFEVRRPGRMTNLGWVFSKMITVDDSFRPELLPLGDLTTGVIGPAPLSKAPTFGVYLLEGLTLHEGPSLKSKRIIDLPPLVTVPVLERNQNATMLHINYLGYDGWIAGFAARKPDNIMDAPQAKGLPPLETIEVVIIPVEIQQAQIDRLRNFMSDRRDNAEALEHFWWSVFRGEIMPCNPPPEVPRYPYSEEDVRELPELQRYTPRLATAVDFLNKSIAPLHQCGVVSPETVGNARDYAINARVIFESSLESLAVLERDVVQARRGK
jgi:hypothetical protein